MNSIQCIELYCDVSVLNENLIKKYQVRILCIEFIIKITIEIIELLNKLYIFTNNLYFCNEFLFFSKFSIRKLLDGSVFILLFSLCFIYYLTNIP